MIVKPRTSTATIKKMGRRGDDRNFYDDMGHGAGKGACSGRSVLE
jgi:hypothetical protein